MKQPSFRKVNEDGQIMATRLLSELVALRQAAAACVRYMDGEVVDGLRTGRHTREVAANIAMHQSRNLKQAVERTGALDPKGYAGVATRIDFSEPDSPRVEDRASS